MEVRRGMLRALRNAGIIVVYQTPDLRVRWAQNLPQNWIQGEISGKTDQDYLPDTVSSRMSDIKRRVLATGIQERLEFRDRVEDGGQWYDMWIDVDHDEKGDVQGIISTIVEITERKQREQTLRALLREVSHRSKNLLAIIQSIATQTGRYSKGIDSFLDRFRGRLQSLASSQDLVTSSNWRGAMLRELVDEQVTRFRGEEEIAVDFHGSNVYLNPNAALHIGLALHELAVNSMSHGALGQPAGRITLRSELQGGTNGDASELILTWDEKTDARELREQGRFGSVALERVVPLSLDGRAEIDVHDDSFSYRLTVPAANFDADAEFLN